MLLGLFQPFLKSSKMDKIVQKVKANTLTILVDFGQYFNFFKTVQIPMQNAWKSIEGILSMVLGLFQPFLKNQKWAKIEQKVKTKKILPNPCKNNIFVNILFLLLACSV